MPAKDLPSTQSLAYRSLLDKLIGDEKTPDDRIVEPAISPIDFIPVPGSTSLRLGRAAAEGAEELAAKTGALQKLKGLFQPAASEDIGKIINPEIYNMQKTGVVSDALKQRAGDLQNQIQDLAHVNDFDYNRLQELRNANNVVPMKQPNLVGNTDTTIPSIQNSDSTSIINTNDLDPKQEALKKLANGY